MDPPPSTASYRPSWRRAPWIAAFAFLWSWVCFRHSYTSNDVDHRVALTGAWLFALFGGIIILRQISGVPRLVLTHDGFTQRTWFEKKRFAWSRYGDFAAGESFLTLESVRFIDRETGFKESMLNFTRLSSDALCQELTRWHDKFGGPVGEQSGHGT